jgi:hypothetical protein
MLFFRFALKLDFSMPIPSKVWSPSAVAGTVTVAEPGAAAAGIGTPYDAEAIHSTSSLWLPMLRTATASWTWLVTAGHGCGPVQVTFAAPSGIEVKSECGRPAAAVAVRRHAIGVASNAHSAGDVFELALREQDGGPPHMSARGVPCLYSITLPPHKRRWPR